jgi:hypothetical protein
MNAILDLRAHARKLDLDLQGIELSEVDRQSAIATWRGRMVNEHISARVFAGLIPQMMKAGLDPDHQAKVATMIADELRHARMCAAAVHALGGEALAELPDLEEVPQHEDVEPLEGFVRNILSISCLSETVAVALIGAERLRVGPKPLKDTLRSILADEVKHARFGWTILEEIVPRLSEDGWDRLDEYLVTAFEHLLAHELTHLPARHSPSRTAEDVGVCDGFEARKLFFDTVEQVIIPGLERCGLAARWAWETAKRPHSDGPGRASDRHSRRLPEHRRETTLVQ